MTEPNILCVDCGKPHAGQSHGSPRGARPRPPTRRCIGCHREWLKTPQGRAYMADQPTLLMITDSEILDVLRFLDGEGVSSVSGFKAANPGISATTVIRRFGSWNAARAAAGLAPVRSAANPLRYTPERCRESLRRIAGIVGHPPTLREYYAHREPGDPSPQTIRDRLGGWPYEVTEPTKGAG